ncbi:hypothetical protein [Streptacidiphilus neutrinimicus]|uniref:hypothetical protein n=1 Tax=Streptacidiphilus neutrinimicus TaxID=105420 RepID=UPI0005A960C9|nr:hypothetical protein [Streptacidiphilus neutrinimicus]
MTSHTTYLLQRIIEEARHALDANDPLEQARLIATLIQPYTGWALRETVLDCRDAGTQWSRIAPEVGLSQAVLSRQVRGTGPVVTIAPSYNASLGNPGAQTPLYLAATILVQRMADLAATAPDTPTAKNLHITVMALGQALAATQPGLLSKTVEEVLRIADAAGEEDHGSGKTVQERLVREAIDELRTAHERGQGAIRMPVELITRTGKGA